MKNIEEKKAYHLRVISVILLCGHPNRLHYEYRPSVRLSVCPALARNSKTKRHGEAKIGVKVAQDRSNRC